MNIELIRNFVLRNKYYITEIENGYIIPNKIKSFLEGKYINIIKNRNNSLNKTESSYSKRFKNDIRSLRGTYKIYCNYIKEFPIIIEDRDLWDMITNKLGISNNTNYYLLDYFFPYLGIAVEIDSEYHDTKQRYDIARDIYIKSVYGLETIRFYKYGENELERKAFIEQFKNTSDSFINYYKSWGIGEYIFPIDFSKTIVDNFIEDNKLPLEFINKLINYIGKWKFMYMESHRISLEELNRIDNNSFPKECKFNKGSIEQLLLDNIIIVLKKIYGKTLIIT